MTGVTGRRWADMTSDDDGSLSFGYTCRPQAGQVDDSQSYAARVSELENSKSGLNKKFSTQLACTDPSEAGESKSTAQSNQSVHKGDDREASKPRRGFNGLMDEIKLANSASAARKIHSTPPTALREDSKTRAYNSISLRSTDIAEENSSEVVGGSDSSTDSSTGQNDKPTRSTKSVNSNGIIRKRRGGEQFVNTKRTRPAGGMRRYLTELIPLSSVPLSRRGCNISVHRSGWPPCVRLQSCRTPPDSTDPVHGDSSTYCEGHNTDPTFEAGQQWERRINYRSSQIAHGKSTREYNNYIQSVPRSRRAPHEPMTPDPKTQVSKREFDGLMLDWRRKLHEYDAVVLKQDSEEPLDEDSEFRKFVLECHSVSTRGSTNC